jgi:hypothetical protein
MFAKLQDAIKNNSLESFKKELRKASKEVFKEYKDDGTLIHWAAYYNAEECLSLIAERLASLEKYEIFSQLDPSGNTPLHWCAYDYSPDSCRFFLTNFQKLVLVPNKKGLLPLHLAAKKNQLEIVDILCSFDETVEEQILAKNGGLMLRQKQGNYPTI